MKLCFQCKRDKPIKKTKTKKRVIKKVKKAVKTKTKRKKASLVEKIWKQQSITHNNCFLCAKKLNEKNRTLEHVFPKWLQHRHDLWNQKLILPNTTGIPYRLITIPCCKKCNGGYLSKLEKQIKAAFESGYDAVSALPKIRLYQWLQLFSYKLLYKDISLLADRRNPDLGTIFSPPYPNLGNRSKLLISFYSGFQSR